MPIFLPAPSHNPGGPDGQGWNRLSTNAHMQGTDQCAKQPRDYPTLYESHDTRKARYGRFGSCDYRGKCDGCPIYNKPRRVLNSFTDRVLFRIDEHGEPWAMNQPEHGWSSLGFVWRWDDLASLEGWDLSGEMCDKHSIGFWLKRSK